MSEQKGVTIRTALQEAIKKLEAARVPDAKAEAEFLLTHLLFLKRHELFLDPERQLTKKESELWNSFIERKANREPSQYIIGETEFYGYRFKVTPDVLIPRPETELLVEEAIKTASSFKGEINIVDLCTGSGCIAIAVAKEIKSSNVFATDISAGALKVAAENAKLNSITERVSFFEGDLFKPLEGTGLENKIHLILSNPPYVSTKDKEILEPEVRDFEPASALLAGDNGLEFYRRIILEAPLYLLSGGYLIMELGYGQADLVRSMAEENGRFASIEVKKDYSGIERVFKAQIKQHEL
ncbi:MAG: peptide chain release factor N(5)-glutamine methyltransferase [Deltaproteobacteria bacterium]|nr:peptide chain release factor N(5)-glutamine methyltransferase [Deltaproteobacteria bacterium]